jgi:hypothetical protein
MTPQELRQEIEGREIDRRELAKKIGCSYGYLNSMVCEFNPLKQKWHDRLVAALKEWKE